MHTVCAAMQPEKQRSWMKQEKSVLFWEKKMRSVNCIIFSFPLTPDNLYFSEHNCNGSVRRFWCCYWVYSMFAWSRSSWFTYYVTSLFWAGHWSGTDKFILFAMPATRNDADSDNQCYLESETQILTKKTNYTLSCQGHVLQCSDWSPSGLVLTVTVSIELKINIMQNGFDLSIER